VALTDDHPMPDPGHRPLARLPGMAPLPRWPGWRHLPRDARDTLFLLGVIGWTILPHLAHLAWWCSLLAVLVLMWRARLALDNAPLPGRWTLVGVLVMAATFTLITERTLLGKEAGVTMLVLLMVLKTLELRARRDALVVFFLGFFLVLTNFLYSQSIAVAAAMLVSVWGLLTALVLAHMPVGQPSLRQAGTLSAKAAMLGAPVMVVLFVLFPRIGPLWGLPQDAGARTGLSGTMRMGGVAEIANDDSVAFRIRFKANPPAPQTLYFRGPVLARFDGVEWRRLEPTFPPDWQLGAELRVQGEPVDYEMTLEPSRLTTLPLLEATPARADATPNVLGWRVIPRNDLEWIVDRPVTERLRFQARAWPRFQHGPTERTWGLRDHVNLPPGFNPRMLQWAAQLRQDPRYATAGADALAAVLLGEIRKGGFVYTLSPGEYGRDAVDEFWFDRRVGFCEHYAASFVVAMRALGIPARVVTGYQGTDPAPVDGYWIVRQSHAHAWAEYWQAGRGWVHADPTAAVAPDRVVQSRNLEPRRGLMAEAISNMSPETLARLRQMWEGVNNRWNQWVLGYSRSQQFNLMERMGVRSPSWSDLGLVLIWLGSGAALAGALWAWWDRHRQDPWQRLHARVRQRLQRLGLATEPHHPPRTLAAEVRGTLGDAGEALAQQLDTLDRLRYAAGAVRRPQPGWWRGFAREAARLQRQRPLQLQPSTGSR
jgi:transglutaminase-like putative cysteine protease